VLYADKHMHKHWRGFAGGIQADADKAMVADSRAAVVDQ
jgi:hypothetical protein